MFAPISPLVNRMARQHDGVRARVDSLASIYLERYWLPEVNNVVMVVVYLIGVGIPKWEEWLYGLQQYRCTDELVSCSFH